MERMQFSGHSVQSLQVFENVGKAYNEPILLITVTKGTAEKYRLKCPLLKKPPSHIAGIFLHYNSPPNSILFAETRDVFPGIFLSCSKSCSRTRACDFSASTLFCIKCKYLLKNLLSDAQWHLNYASCRFQV